MKKSISLKTKACVGLIASSMFGALMIGENSEQRQPAKSISRPSISVIDSSIPEGPIYSQSEVPAGMCSRYVRKAALDVFGIQYPSADAWDMRNSLNIDEIKVNSEKLIQLAKDGTLKPGMILGIYYPKSHYNVRAEKAGAGYTHLGIYLGKDNEKLYFADKFGKLTRTKISLDELVSKGLEPRELLFLSNKQ